MYLQSFWSSKWTGRPTEMSCLNHLLLRQKQINIYNKLRFSLRWEGIINYSKLYLRKKQISKKRLIIYWRYNSLPSFWRLIIYATRSDWTLLQVAALTINHPFPDAIYSHLLFVKLHRTPWILFSEGVYTGKNEMFNYLFISPLRCIVRLHFNCAL